MEIVRYNIKEGGISMKLKKLSTLLMAVFSAALIAMPLSARAAEAGAETAELIAADEPGEDMTAFEDGYSAGMTAVVQKDNTIKVSWSGKATENAQSYKLYQRLRDDSGWHEVYSGTDTSYIDKDFSNTIDKATYLNVYLLEKYSGAGTLTASYLTPASPMLFYIEAKGEQLLEYGFSGMLDVASVTYELRAAETETGVSAASPRSVSSTALLIRDRYDVGGGVTIGMVQASNNLLTLTSGKTYYGGVSAVYTKGGKSFASKPSNVCNDTYNVVESNKCTVFDITGLRYQKGNTAANIARLNRHVQYDLDQYQQTDYVHSVYNGPCNGCGYILFALPKGTGTNVASFEILKGVTGEDGQVIARISKNKTKKVFSINSPADYSDKECYAIYFNKLDKKKGYYYNIRPVGYDGVEGLTDVGFFYEPRPDRVVDVTTKTLSASKVGISWKHDDCVKKYEIYRSLKHTSEFAESDNIYDLNKYYIRLAAVSASSGIVNGYHSYNDTKVPDADGAYYYVIKPIITQAIASQEFYDILYCSAPVAGQASVSKAKVKALNVSSSKLGHITLSWKGLKNVYSYNIVRYRGSSEDDYFTYDIKGGQKKVQTYTDVVELGKTYYYTIRPASDSEEGKRTKSATITSNPSKISNLKAERRSSGRGAYVTWTGNEGDKSAASELRYKYLYQIQIDDGDWKEVSSSYYNDESDLKTGTERTYRVRAICKKGGKVQAYSDAISVKFKTTGEITLKDTNGNTISSISVQVGRRVEVRAYSASNANMTVNAVGGGGAIEYASQMTGSGSDRYLNIRIGGLTAGRNQELEVTSSDGASLKFTVYVTN